MASIQDKIKKFIRDELDTVPPASRFELCVTDVDDRTESLSQHNYEPGPPRVIAEKLTENIMDSARSATESMMHTARFKLYSILRKAPVEGSRKVPIVKRRHFPFFLQSQAHNVLHGTGITESEPPNERGLTGQLMRHLEATQRTLHEVSSHAIDAMAAENRSLREQLSGSEATRLETYKIREQLLNTQNDRDVAKTRVQAEEERKQQVLKLLAEKLLPSLAESIPGLLSRVFGARNGLAGALPAPIPLAGPGPAQAIPLTSVGPAQPEETPGPAGVQLHPDTQKLNDFRSTLFALYNEDPDLLVAFMEKLPPHHRKAVDSLIGI